MAGFYGLDIYNMSGSIEAVLAYLDEHDPEAAAVARERYGCLTPWQADPAIYGRAALHPRLSASARRRSSPSAASCSTKRLDRGRRSCSAQR